MPITNGPFPAVILIHGSSALDRAMKQYLVINLFSCCQITSQNMVVLHRTNEVDEEMIAIDTRVRKIVTGIVKKETNRDVAKTLLSLNERNF